MDPRTAKVRESAGIVVPLASTRKRQADRLPGRHPADRLRQSISLAQIIRER
jgi:hypothetical protein